MPVTTEVGRTTLGAGNLSLTVTRTPKLACALCGRQTADGYVADAALTHAIMGASLSGCISAQEVDNQSTDCNSLVAGWGFAAQAYTAEQVKTGSQTFYKYQTAAFSASAITAVLEGGAPGGTELIDYIAADGADIQAVKFGTFNLNQATGEQTVTGVGFTPDLVLLFWGAWKSVAMGANTAMSLGYGAFDGRGNQWAIGTAGQGPTNSTHKTMQLTNRCIASGNLTTLASDATGVRMTSDGFVINVQTGDSNRSVPIGYVAIKGPMCRVGSFSKRTSNGVDQVDLKFIPKLAFFASHGTPSSASVQADTTVSYGYTNGVSSFGRWAGMKDGSATTGAHSRSSNAKAIMIAAASAAGVTPTTLAEADVSFAGTSMLVNWTTNDANADEVLYWAIGEKFPTPNRGGSLPWPMRS